MPLITLANHFIQKHHFTLDYLKGVQRAASFPRDMYYWSKQNVFSMMPLNSVNKHKHQVYKVLYRDGTVSTYKISPWFMNAELFFKLAEMLGIDNVPLTFSRDLGKGTGIVMSYVDGFVAWEKEDPVSSTIKYLDRRRDYIIMCVLDTLTLNFDRHSKNWLFGEDGRIYMIDNDWAFTTFGKYGSFTDLIDKKDILKSFPKEELQYVLSWFLENKYILQDFYNKYKMEFYAMAHIKDPRVLKEMRGWKSSFKGYEKESNGESVWARERSAVVENSLRRLIEKIQ